MRHDERIAQEQKLFEAWAVDNLDSVGSDVEKRVDGNYSLPAVRGAWKVWWYLRIMMDDGFNNAVGRE